MKTTIKKTKKAMAKPSQHSIVAAIVAGATGAAKRFLDKLAGIECPLVRWQLAHGKLGRQSPRLVAALGLPGIAENTASIEQACRDSACLLNEARQAGLDCVPAGKAGEGKARAFPSGSLMLSLKGTLLGAVLADAWWTTAEESAADIKAGRKPGGLLVPAEAKDAVRSRHGTAESPLRYSPPMARAAAKLAGVGVKGLDSAAISERLDVMTLPAKGKAATKAKAETIAAKAA